MPIGLTSLNYLDFVIRIDEKTLKGSKQQIEAAKELVRDAGIIEAACLAIKAGIDTKEESFV